MEIWNDLTELYGMDVRLSFHVFFVVLATLIAGRCVRHIIVNLGSKFRATENVLDDAFFD